MTSDTDATGTPNSGGRSRDSAAPPLRGAAAKNAQSKDRDMGTALRSVYQKTVEEAVPDDLIALLGKLD